MLDYIHILCKAIPNWSARQDIFSVAKPTMLKFFWSLLFFIFMKNRIFWQEKFTIRIYLFQTPNVYDESYFNTNTLILALLAFSFNFTMKLGQTLNSNKICVGTTDESDSLELYELELYTYRYLCAYNSKNIKHN